MTIKIISALSSNYIIGSNGKIPWFIKGELKRFKHITLNHNVIMGRKTFDSIGKVLEKRTNIIISKNKNLKIKNIWGDEFKAKYGFKCPLGVKGRNSHNKLFHEKVGWQVSQPLREGMLNTYNWIEDQVKSNK